MKNIILTLALFVAFAATALATNPYSVPTNPEVTGTLNIKATVNHVPITITIPDNGVIDLGGVDPGETKTSWTGDANKIDIAVSFAKGYALKVVTSAPVKVDGIDGPVVTIKAEWYFTYKDTKYGPYAIPGTAFTGTGNTECPGEAVMEVVITELKAPDGAYAGDRQWSITGTAEYYE